MADEFREFDAAYVLGALSSDDRRDFETHLRTCVDCSASVRELAGLPGMLAAVPREVVELAPIEPPPEMLLPSLVRQLRRESRTRRWAIGLAAAAAAAAVGVAGTELVRPDGGQTPPIATATSTPGQVMTALTSSPLAAQVTLNRVDWGTRLDLTCTYDEGSRYNGSGAPTYVLVVRGKDGTTEHVASWRVVPGKTMRLSGATSLPRANIAAVSVQTTAGTPLLELAL